MTQRYHGHPAQPPTHERLLRRVLMGTYPTNVGQYSSLMPGADTPEVQNSYATDYEPQARTSTFLSRGCKTHERIPACIWRCTGLQLGNKSYRPKEDVEWAMTAPNNALDMIWAYFPSGTAACDLLSTECVFFLRDELVF